MIDIAQGIAAWILSGPEGWACGFVLAVFIVLPFVNMLDKARERSFLKREKAGYAKAEYRLSRYDY